MTLTNEQIENIKIEFNQWFDKQYANKTLEERQKLGAFFTPPELTIKMLEKFSNISEPLVDPCAGSGNLLAAAIIAGADPKKVYYNEYDHEIFEIGKKRLMGLGVPEKNFICSDALSEVFWDFLRNEGVIKKPKFIQQFGRI